MLLILSISFNNAKIYLYNLLILTLLLNISQILYVMLDTLVITMMAGLFLTFIISTLLLLYFLWDQLIR